MNFCENCNIEFIPKHLTRGHKQIYCSVKCRNLAYAIRSKYKNNIVIKIPSVESNYKILNKNFVINLIIESLEKNKQQ